MKKSMQILLLLTFIFSIFACIPVPVPVGTSQPGYSGEYGYGYEDQYGYGYDDEYYDAPIVYGEPCYYTPPIAVTFAFDYFTYEPDGPYVDIVFWKNGHRYRHEPWHDHGRRITAENIHSKEWHNRVRGSELSRHREKLRSDHNISHPDSYYGVKSRDKGKIEQPTRQKDKGYQGEQGVPREGEQPPRWEKKQPYPVNQPSRREQESQPQIQQRPEWGKQTPKPEAEHETQKTKQKSQWEQKQSRDEDQLPQLESKTVPQTEQRSQWGQTSEQTKQKRDWKKQSQPTDQKTRWGQEPQQEEKRPSWSQKQTTQGTVRQQSEQKKQRYQYDRQKRSQDKQKRIKERIKKPEAEQGHDTQEMKKNKSPRGE